MSIPNLCVRLDAMPNHDSPEAAQLLREITDLMRTDPVAPEQLFAHDATDVNLLKRLEWHVLPS